MSAAELARDAVRPPFANYDIVVYFGCGLFVLPFIRHYYLDPFGLRPPRFEFVADIPFAGIVVSSLAMLFTVYIIGHILAYVGAQFVEKTMDTYFGKASDMVLLTTVKSGGARNSSVRERMRENSQLAWNRPGRLAVAARTFWHLPVMPIYLAMVWLGAFGFYTSRIPISILECARTRLIGSDMCAVEIEPGSPWFKALEGYVINNYPVATARMYNYLVISGLFRSVSTVFLVSIWFEIYYALDRALYNHTHINNFMADTHGVGMQVWGYCLLTAAYMFSLLSYLKFQRRYVEETVFAFALTKES